MVANPLLDVYLAKRDHEANCRADSEFTRKHGFEDFNRFRNGQPSHHGCTTCMMARIVDDYSDPRPDYAWAVPDDEALALIMEHSPNGIVEIGAGLGYWASLLQALGHTVYPYDIEPEANHWCTGKAFTTVAQGGPEMAAKHPDAALFLCWPPYDHPMAMEALDAYEGDTVIYIGEGMGGCTANAQFHLALEGVTDWCYSCQRDDNEPYCSYAIGSGGKTCKDMVMIKGHDWREVAHYQQPQWHGLHDNLTIYYKKTKELR